MLDQIIIEGIGSLDFDASVSKRKIEFPQKKEIKETIPYSNITYDFSRIEGEQFYEERELEYELEIVANTPEQLEAKKQNLCSWLSDVFQKRMQDPFIGGYHFVVTTKEIEVDDEENQEKTTVRVIFNAYPYKIKNEETIITSDYSSYIKTVTVDNHSDHTIIPEISCTTTVIITMNNNSFSLAPGAIKTSKFKLKKGRNDFQLKASQPGTLSIKFNEEVI